MGLDFAFRLGGLSITVGIGERLALVAVLAVNFAAFWLCLLFRDRGRR